MNLGIRTKYAIKIQSIEHERNFATAGFHHKKEGLQFSMEGEEKIRFKIKIGEIF